MSYKNVFYFCSLSIFFFSCGPKSEAPPKKVGTYTVSTVPLRDVTSYDEYPASIEGKTNNEIRAKISGYIKQVLVDEGAVVRRGQILFRLETNTLTQNADAARAGVSAAGSAINAARADVRTAQVEVDKLRPLVDKKIISEVQLHTAEARLLSAQSKLQQSMAGQQEARAQYNSINENINYSVIRSPINGVVGKLPLKAGSLVGPTDQMPITTVSDISGVVAYFSMNEKDYLNFLEDTPGKTVKEKLNNLPLVDLELVNGSAYPEKGKISAVTGQIDPATGTILFRASFPNKAGLLSNGNSGTVKIPRTYKQVLVVPEAAT